MRLWSLHPKYLDSSGLVALWREALLARKVLENNTRGYQSHPQLHRFKTHSQPLPAIEAYLVALYIESVRRGYRFDASKVQHLSFTELINCTEGQVEFERGHLKNKLSIRAPQLLVNLPSHFRQIKLHPIFKIIPGPIAEWERATE